MAEISDAEAAAGNKAAGKILRARHAFLAWKVISLQEYSQLRLVVQNYPEVFVEVALFAEVREALAEITGRLVLDLFL
jgi:hypothetical protein